MAELTYSLGSFSLLSTWTTIPWSPYMTDPTTAINDIAVTLNGFTGAVSSAYITANLGSPATGAAINNVQLHGVWSSGSWSNGQAPVNGAMAGGNQYTIRFQFKANGTTNPPFGNRSSSLAISDAVLHVVYDAPSSDPPTGGVTYGNTYPSLEVYIDRASTYPGGLAKLSWSGGGPGTNNPVLGYKIYYTTGSGWQPLTANDVDTYGLEYWWTAPMANNVGYAFSIVTVGYIAGYNSGHTAWTPGCNIAVSALPNPTGLSLVSNLISVGDTTVLSWSLGSPGYGTNNPLAYYAVYKNGSLFGTTTGTSITVPSRQDDGTESFTVKAFGTVAGYDSQVSAAIVLTTFAYGACTAPSSATLSASVSESDVTLFYSGAAAGAYNAITGYEIEYAESSNGSTWGAWTALKTVSNSGTSGTTSAAVSSTRGNYRKYRIRTQGAAGASFYSGWTETGSVRRNAAPSAPSVTAPAAGTTIYNSTPRILVTVGADADSNTQTVAATGYTPSSGGNQAVGKKLVLRRTSAYGAGSQSVSVASTDSFGVGSSAVSRSFTYAAPSWTDGTLTAGTTKIKAAHMNELRTAVNNIRAYYGMAAVSWAQAITAGSTSLGGWKDHVLELRAAIDAIATLVNGWDTASSTHNIPAISWLAIPTNKPTKAVMDQLRAVIPTL